ETQRERRVRRHLESFLGERGLADVPAITAQDRLHFIFIALVDGDSVRLDLPHEDDQGIVAGFHRSFSTFVELLANSHIAELGSVNQLLGALVRSLTSQGFLHVCIVCAKNVLHFGQALGQQSLLQRFVSGGGGEQSLLQRG